MKDNPSALLAALLERYPIPVGWQKPDIFQQDFALGKLQMSMVGVTAKSMDGQFVGGSAAQTSGKPLSRAYFEFVERLSILEFERRPPDAVNLKDDAGEPVLSINYQTVFPKSPEPSEWAFAKSNGIAVGTSFSSASQAAFAEACERDAVLRSWYGGPSPVRLAMPDLSYELNPHYEMECYRFEGRPSRETSLVVVGVFGFPLAAHAPLIFGFGAGADSVEATERASRECLQRLAFLWGEELPTAPPEFSATADYHQEYYLYPQHFEALRKWLSSGARQKSVAQSERFGEGIEAPLFVDLTPECLREKIYVVKAYTPGRLPLTFGRCPWFGAREAIHPIA